jgi:hypothetical protein
MNEITVQTKDGEALSIKRMLFSLLCFYTASVEELIGHTDTKFVSDATVGHLVRQMALHANVSVSH